MGVAVGLSGQQHAGQQGRIYEFFDVGGGGGGFWAGIFHGGVCVGSTFAGIFIY